MMLKKLLMEGIFDFLHQINMKIIIFRNKSFVLD